VSEQTRLDRLRQIFAAAPLPQGVKVGIGDDAAVVAPSNAASLVWTVDCAVDMVHFRREWMSLEDIGWRSLMAAASDLAGMGAGPRGILSSLILPPGFTDEELERLASGQLEAASALGTAILGGNLSRGSELSITTNVLGEATTPVLRSGARAGDVVALAGNVGLSAAGLEALRRGRSEGDVLVAIDACKRPRARIAEGLLAAPSAHAGIDLSDGLVLDASRLATESGVSIVLEAERILSANGTALGVAAASLALDPLELALFGGEDYALLMIFPPGAVVSPFVPIGTCEAEQGIFLVAPDGSRQKLEPRGFDHFAT
jgi:thiamine-monophosphate kinase